MAAEAIIKPLDPSKTTIILGPPGTGKTTTLLNIVEEAMVSGVSPKDIAFISFTKKAADEGKDRAMHRFGLPETEFPHFRTLHSMAFKFLGMRRDQTFGWTHLKELGKKLGMDFKGRGQLTDDTEVYGMNTSDRMLFLEGLSRNCLEPLQTVWQRAAEDAINWWELDRFAKSLKIFKEANMLLDFTDMLEGFMAIGLSQMPKLKLLVIDEAQDLSPLQWQCVDMLAANSEQVYVGGDDRQGIFQWAGSSTEHFISLPGTVRVLEQSHRIPQEVHKIAESIAARISNKRPVSWKPRDAVGAVNYYTSVDEIDMDNGSWLLLARNGYFLNDLENYCLAQGYSFNSISRDPLKSQALDALKIWESLRKGYEVTASQMLDVAKFMTPREIARELVEKLKNEEEDAPHSMGELRKSGLHTDIPWWQAMPRISPTERDYFRAVLRRKEPLLRKPRIKLSTIHASKGGEADHVVLVSDCSYRTYQNMTADEDPEHRVWYVGATRCLSSLNIISPKTNLAYII